MYLRYILLSCCVFICNCTEVDVSNLIKVRLWNNEYYPVKGTKFADGANFVNSFHNTNFVLKGTNSNAIKFRNINFRITSVFDGKMRYTPDTFLDKLPFSKGKRYDVVIGKVRILKNLKIVFDDGTELTVTNNIEVTSEDFSSGDTSGNKFLSVIARSVKKDLSNYIIDSLFFIKEDSAYSFKNDHYFIVNRIFTSTDIEKIILAKKATVATSSQPKKNNAKQSKGCCCK